MRLIRGTKSRLISKLNAKQTRASFLFYGLAILAFFAFMLPAVYRISTENIKNTAGIVSDEYYALIEDFQAQLNRFIHSSEATRCLGDYSADPSDKNAAHIAILAQSARASDAEILNICVDDHKNRLISSMNNAQVDRAAILAGLPGYARLKEGAATSFLSPVMDGAFSDRDGADIPYIVYARNVAAQGDTYTVSLFYNMSYFLARLEMIGAGRIDGYSLLDQENRLLYATDGFPTGAGAIAEFAQAARPSDHLNRMDGYYRFSRLNERGILVVTFVRYWTIFAEIFPSLILVLIVLLLLPIINTFGLTRINRVVLEPLTELSREIRAYYPGKTSVPQHDTDDEISDLGQDFARMMHKVNQQVEDIHARERDNAITQYRLLATQIDPHFIYNTMSLINALAYNGDTEGVMKVNTALIRLLRERLNAKATIMDTVRCELDTLREYLRIMAYRYGDDVSVHIDADQPLLGAQIPKNLLQPLVENAFFHGLTNDAGACKGNISILIYEMADKTVIEVSDDGRGMSARDMDALNRGEANATGDRQAHIGFDNIRQRLKYIYQDDFELTVYSVEDRGSTVTIVLPTRRSAASE